jgi:hypothetical protein
MANCYSQPTSLYHHLVGIISNKEVNLELAVSRLALTYTAFCTASTLTGILSVGVKWPGYKAGYSLPSSAKVTTACCFIKQRDYSDSFI